LHTPLGVLGLHRSGIQTPSVGNVLFGATLFLFFGLIVVRAYNTVHPPRTILT